MIVSYFFSSLVLARFASVCMCAYVCVGVCGCFLRAVPGAAGVQLAGWLDNPGWRVPGEPGVAVSGLARFRGFEAGDP